MSFPIDIDIDNVIAVQCEDTVQREKALEAVRAFAEEAGNGFQRSDKRVYFRSKWEPPFRALKKLSQEMPEVTFTLWADAFREHHWICKVDYRAGQGEEQTLSRIDEIFPAVFAEIYGCGEAAWEKKPAAPFAQWFPQR